MPLVTRRVLLGAAAAAATTAATAAAVPLQLSANETIELWPGPPPGTGSAAIVRKVDDQDKTGTAPDRWISGIARPVMIVFRAPRPDGSAVLIAPGGGYGFLSYDNEGTAQAAWLNARGTTAFILLYRLPGEGWHQRQDVPLQDAQRAMRLIRARADHFGIQRDRIAVLGFSAGGHLAGSLATRHAERIYAPIDAADQIDARPDLAALLYPVVSLEAPFTHGGSRDALLGPDAPERMRLAYSVEHRVDATTPPIFLTAAADDGLVPPANSIALFNAMQAAQRPVALHIFESGGHGFGARLPKSNPGSTWPSLMERFAISHGLFAGNYG
ncbi:alpha/beta hydrolase [Sphingomonas abietis]|uniref:Alpha/beta hydrolase n=1 Tax=Sphingomonas abietis TaxID=3012344 RepID=A0ABY7NPF5_9SPHN|nr:alpha/beta hydrolase [Sphingomonas abietis]WBO23412.1 alpha/beta hydrolase [Sphingomonas abietis]